MAWTVRYTRTFLKELARLPHPVRKRVENIAFNSDISENPFLDGKVQKLTGYQEFYKLRIGQYRIGLKLDKNKQVIEFRHVAHRKDIYREFP